MHTVGDGAVVGKRHGRECDGDKEEPHRGGVNGCRAVLQTGDVTLLRPSGRPCLPVAAVRRPCWYRVLEASLAACVESPRHTPWHVHVHPRLPPAYIPL